MAGRLTQAAEKATDEWAIAADWTANLAIAGQCRDVQQCHAVLSVILRRLREPSAAVQLRSLELLQACMGNSACMVQVVHARGTQDQLVGVLEGMRDYRAKNKLLNMMRAWAEAYGGGGAMAGFERTRRQLEMSGTRWPGRDDDSHYSPPGGASMGGGAARQAYDARPACSRRANAAHAPSMPQPYPPPQVGASPYAQPPAASYPPASHPPASHPPASRPAVQQPTGRVTVSEVAEAEGRVGLLGDVLAAIAASGEAVAGNELVEELLGACEAARKRIVEHVGREEDESLLMRMLQCNDSIGELQARHAALLRGGRQAGSSGVGASPPVVSPVASAPAVAPVAPASQLSGVSDVSLELDVGHLTHAAPSAAAYGTPWLAMDGEDVQLDLPMPAMRQKTQKTPRKEAAREEQPGTADLLSLSSPPPATSSTPSVQQVSAKVDDDFDAFFDQLAVRDRPAGGQAPAAAPPLVAPVAAVQPVAATPSVDLLDILSQPLSQQPVQQQPMQAQGMLGMQGMGMQGRPVYGMQQPAYGTQQQQNQQQQQQNQQQQGGAQGYGMQGGYGGYGQRR